MGLLTRCGRTVFNLLPLRGRKRRPVKLCVLLFLSAAVFVFGMSGMCLLDSRMCAEEGGGEGEWPGQLRSREPAELYVSSMYTLYTVSLPTRCATRIIYIHVPYIGGEAKPRATP